MPASLHCCLNSGLEQRTDLFTVCTTCCLHHDPHQRPHGTHAPFFDEVQPLCNNTVDDVGQAADVGRREIVRFTVSKQRFVSNVLARVSFNHVVHVVPSQCTFLFEPQDIGEKGR